MHLKLNFHATSYYPVIDGSHMASHTLHLIMIYLGGRCDRGHQGDYQQSWLLQAGADCPDDPQQVPTQGRGVQEGQRDHL